LLRLLISVAAGSYQRIFPDAVLVGCDIADEQAKPHLAIAALRDKIFVS